MKEAAPPVEKAATRLKEAKPAEAQAMKQEAKAHRTLAVREPKTKGEEPRLAATPLPTSAIFPGHAQTNPETSLELEAATHSVRQRQPQTQTAAPLRDPLGVNPQEETQGLPCSSDSSVLLSYAVKRCLLTKANR